MKERGIFRKVIFMREKRKIILEIGINAVFITIAIGMFIVSRKYKLVRGNLLGARTFPMLIGSLLSIFAIVNITGAIRSLQATRENVDENTLEEVEIVTDFKSYIRKNRVGVAFGMMVIYYLLLLYFGFIISTVLFLPAMLYLLEYRKPIRMLLVTVFGIAFLYIAFKVLLGVPLPQGIIFS